MQSIAEQYCNNKLKRDELTVTRDIALKDRKRPGGLDRMPSDSGDKLGEKGKKGGPAAKKKVMKKPDGVMKKPAGIERKGAYEETS
eukprot:9862908-Alexandrium_andersonii.AAC.1